MHYFHLFFYERVESIFQQLREWLKTYCYEDVLFNDLVFDDLYHFMAHQCPKYADDMPCQCEPDTVADDDWVAHYWTPIVQMYTIFFKEDHTFPHFIAFLKCCSRQERWIAFV